MDELLSYDLEQSEDSETVPAFTDSNTKRAYLGMLVGGILFVGLVIAIVVLILTAGLEYKPDPKKPDIIWMAPNPYVVKYYTRETPHSARVVLYNNRTLIQKNPADSIPWELIITNTSDNYEPETIVVDFKQIDEHQFNVRFTDPGNERWEIPPYESDQDPYVEASRNIRPVLNISTAPEGKQFYWSVYENDVILTTQGCRLAFFDKFLEFEGKIQNSYIYGVGEQVAQFMAQEGNYTLWNYASESVFRQRSTDGVFGSHPFFLSRLNKTNKFIGIFMRNSNAMYFSFWGDANNTFINYKIIGGIIDLYLFYAAEPEYIVRKYHSIIGRPYLPPIWAMGYQYAREGANLEDLKSIYASHGKYAIPIDAFWADTEMTVEGKTFTINNRSYSGLENFVNILHRNNTRFVVMTNPGLKVEQGYIYYDEAVNQNCLIKSAKTNKPFEGMTYADRTVWLDFFNEESLHIWTQGLIDLHSSAKMDGVWISMNEPTQLCDGECYKTAYPLHNETEFNGLQFRPTTDPLETSTLPVSAYHELNSLYGKQFFTHNLFSLQLDKVTHKSLAAYFEEKRFLILSRSSFAGSGHYSSHWIDHNIAQIEYLQDCIPAMFSFNIFGIPHVGSPIGGFHGNASKELLIRWFQLAAFSPLMFSYSDMHSTHKDPFSIDEETTKIIKEAILKRYRLIRFFYTKIFEAFLWGGPVVHPMFFAFPNDELTYPEAQVSKNFMWGKTLLVLPTLLIGASTVTAYLPNWRWYNLNTLEMFVDYKVNEKHGQNHTLKQPLENITVFIKGGSIVPYQDLDDVRGAMNTEDLQNIPLTLIVAPDHFGRASGTMVVDSEGIKPDPHSSGDTYRHYAFTYMNQIFRVNKLSGFGFKLIYGVDKFWKLVILDTFTQKGTTFACYMDMNYYKRELKYEYIDNKLVISSKNGEAISMHDFESIVWGTEDQHNFCSMSTLLTSMVVEDQGRTIFGQMQSSETIGRKIKYELRVKLLMNKLISMQISILTEPPDYKWIVPEIIDDEVRKNLKSTTSLEAVGFSLGPTKGPFYFSLADPKDSRNFIFTSKSLPLTFLSNYIHLKMIINSKHIFGLGERISEFELKDGIYSIFTFDQTARETGVPPGNNMWGAHPFYLVQLHEASKFAAVLFLNSNPMDIKINHVNTQMNVDHIFIGGIIDAFFLWGDSVDEIIVNYQYLIGKPAPLPYWAFGYHQCRWGYISLEHVKQVVNSFTHYDIPLDGVWLDMDYMSNQKDFTVDRRNWLSLPLYVNELHNKSLKLVVLVDPALAIDDNYEPYIEGLQKDAFILSSFTERPLVGISWPGYAVYIDFIQATSTGFWDNCLSKFHNLINYDGLWLDMNEPSSFCDGECPDRIHYQYYDFPLDFYDNLYYNPTHRAIEHRTLSMEALHHTERNKAEFNYHSLYGFLESKSTAEFFIDKLKRRPFVLSSSTFPGSGRYVGHWAGDNQSTWSWMQISLSSIFNFQLFGIPFVGADVCGFGGNASVSLCSRWMQLGAFYPLMRNHNSKYSVPQEPFTNAKLASVSRTAIRTRYLLSRYLYTLHMRTTLHGGLYIKPVLFEFPTDNETYAILEEAFMVGSALRVTPVLKDLVSVVEAYFPNHDWYDFNKLRQVMHYDPSATRGKVLSFEASLESEIISIHIKGGSIVVVGDTQHIKEVTRIVQMQNFPTELILAPHKNQAIGYVYFDMDEEMSYKDGIYHEYQISMNSAGMKVELIGGNATWKYNKTDEMISQIKVLGLNKASDIKCVKLLDRIHGTYSELNFKLSDEVLLIKAKEGQELRYPNINSIVWLNAPC